MARPAGSKNKTPKAAADMSLLSSEEIIALRAKAKEQVAIEAKEAASDQALEQFIEDEQRSKGLKESNAEVTIDLAPYCDKILLDNRSFFQGQTYVVRVSVAQVLREAMQRTWGHQSEIDGKSENFYRRQKHTRILPSGGVVNTSQLLRA